MEVLRKLITTSILCLLLTFSACTKDAAKSYDFNSAPVIIRALGCDNEDVTASGCAGKVRLYIYNEQQDLIEWFDIDENDIKNSKPIRLSYPKNKRVYIEAVNLSSNNDIIYPEWDHYLNEFSLTFTAVEEMTNTREIFLGSTVYDNTHNESSPHYIDIKRTVGKMRVILTGNVKERASYHIQIKKISAQINHEKAGFDERLEITPDLYYKANEITTNYISTFPSEQESGIIVNIYRGDSYVSSISRDINGNLFQNAIDKTLEINIDLSALTAEVSVSPWVSEDIDIEI